MQKPALFSLILDDIQQRLDEHAKVCKACWDAPIKPEAFATSASHLPLSACFVQHVRQRRDGHDVLSRCICLTLTHRQVKTGSSGLVSVKLGICIVVLPSTGLTAEQRQIHTGPCVSVRTKIYRKCALLADISVSTHTSGVFGVCSMLECWLCIIRSDLGHAESIAKDSVYSNQTTMLLQSFILCEDGETRQI